MTQLPAPGGGRARYLAKQARVQAQEAVPTCGGKRRYASPEVARSVGLENMTLNPELSLWMYQCPDCRGWHHTRSAQRDPLLEVNYYERQA